MPFDLFIYDVFRQRIHLITESLIASRLVPLLLARLWIMTSVARDIAQGNALGGVSTKQ